MTYNVYTSIRTEESFGDDHVDVDDPIVQRRKAQISPYGISMVNFIRAVIRNEVIDTAAMAGVFDTSQKTNQLEKVGGVNGIVFEIDC